MKFDVVAFDADDTLWHNEVYYERGRQLFERLFADILEPESAGELLSQIEVDNIYHYGYGIKSFVLSMVETALEVKGNQIKNFQITEILRFAKQTLHAELEFLEGVETTLEVLSEDFELMLVTKGDLYEQNLKIARSGLATYFKYIEVLSEKNVGDYRRLLSKYSISPNRFLMVGNSLRSDIFPVVELGGKAIHIPYASTWAHEKILERPLKSDEYFVLEHIGQTPAFIREL